MGLLDIFGGGGHPIATTTPTPDCCPKRRQRAMRSEGFGAIAGALARAAQGINGQRVGFGQGIGLAAEALDNAQSAGALKFLHIQKLAARQPI